MDARDHEIGTIRTVLYILRTENVLSMVLRIIFEAKGFVRHCIQVV